MIIHRNYSPSWKIFYLISKIYPPVSIGIKARPRVPCSPCVHWNPLLLRPPPVVCDYSFFFFYNFLLMSYVLPHDALGPLQSSSWGGAVMYVEKWHWHRDISATFASKHCEYSGGSCSLKSEGGSCDLWSPIASKRHKCEAQTRTVDLAPL